MHGFDVSNPNLRSAVYLIAQQRMQAASTTTTATELCGRIEADMIPKVREVHDAVLGGERWIAEFTPRRSSKTTGATQIAAHIALRTQNPVAVVPYISLSRVHAKAYFWEMLKDLDRRLSLGLVFNEADLTARVPGGTRIALYGLDDRTAVEKVLGGKLAAAIIDEAQSQPSYLAEFIDTRLRPALADYAAPLFVLGTPHPACAGWFYELTKDALPRARTSARGGWSVYRWDLRDNTKLPRPAEEILAEELEACGGDPASPLYRMNWLGEWHRIAEALVYGGFSDDANTYTGALPPADWSYGLGVDVGWHDADAFAVIAYSATMPRAYFVEAFARPGQTWSQTADCIEEVVGRYNPNVIVMDAGGTSKKAAEEFVQRRSLNVAPAQKAHKLSAIAVLNSDLKAGRVVANAEKCGALLHQWRTLPWEDAARHDREMQGVPNDVADAALYIFREAHHYLYAEQPAKPKPGTDDHRRAQMEERKRRALGRGSKHWTRRLAS